jgi:hypothetical protein
MDSLYNTFIVFPLFKSAYYYAYFNLDKGWLEFIGPTGIKVVVNKFSFFLNMLQTGYVDQYVFVMILGFLLVVFCVEFFYFSSIYSQ